MAEKVLMIKSGGAVVITVERVNLFALTDAERKLLVDLAEAVRTYERQAEKGIGNGNTTPLES